jgi:SAM-dependent methyltransferase
MVDLNDDFVKSSDYVDTYFHTATPGHLSFLARLFDAPLPPLKGLQYCDLGCGTGNHLFWLAANHPQHQFYGFDYSEKAIEKSKQRAETYGLTNLTFQALSFEEILKKQNDLPKFDIMSAHGILSWITPEQQNNVLSIAERFLNPGGLFYITYNCHPGRSYDQILRPLFEEIMADLGENATPQQAIDELKKLVEGEQMQHFSKGENAILKIYPRLDAKLKDIFNTFEPAYVAHEYMASSYEVFYSSHMIRRLRHHGLNFLTTTDSIRQTFPEKTKLTINILPRFESIERIEVSKDFITNNALRRDIYIKSERPVFQDTCLEDKLKDIRFFCPIPPHKISDESLSAEDKTIYFMRPLLSACETPRSLNDLLQLPELQDIFDYTLLQAILFLYGRNCLSFTTSSGLALNETQKQSHYEMNIRLLEEFQFEDKDVLVCPQHGESIKLSKETAVSCSAFIILKSVSMIRP